MEVHHHHTHPAPGETHSQGPPSGHIGKKFKHYIFEFFMLFLAVFCGFLAENIREHEIENKREQQFIISLVSDLEDDTLRISKQIDDIDNGILLFDSLSVFLETPQSAKKNIEVIYYTSRMGIRLAPFVNNNRTIDQLKNSGGFRLIRKQETANNIMKYYSEFPELRMIEGFFDQENIAFKALASKIMDQAIYRKQINPDGSVARITGNLSLLTYDSVMLNQLGFYAIEMNGSRKGMLQSLQNLKQSAIGLIKYLEKTYHLE